MLTDEYGEPNEKYEDRSGWIYVNADNVRSIALIKNVEHESITLMYLFTNYDDGKAEGKAMLDDLLFSVWSCRRRKLIPPAPLRTGSHAFRGTSTHSPSALQC